MLHAYFLLLENIYNEDYLYSDISQLSINFTLILHTQEKYMYVYMSIYTHILLELWDWGVLIGIRRVGVGRENSGLLFEVFA